MRKLLSMRKLLGPAIVACAALLGTTLPSLADPNLPNIRPHRHFIELADDTLVEVGPRVCDNPALQTAFNQFHSNVHHAVPDSPGPVESAPGLHNGFGAELVAGSC